MECPLVKFVLTGTILTFINTVSGSLELKRPPKCEKPCFNNGVCHNGTCTCASGWAGSQCENCFGRLILTARSGVISHGFENYTVNQRCTWLIDGNKFYGGASRIRLTIDSFATECDWDHVFIYAGDGLYSKQVAALSGVISTSEKYSASEIIVQSPQVYLFFFSDTAYNMSGFNISYRFDGCPKDCSGHGTCNETSGQCQCDDYWDGAACDVPNCFGEGCNHRGYCDPENSGRCKCDNDTTPLYWGPRCEVPTSAGLWEVLQPADSQTMGGRAAHGAVVVGDEMWVIGGEHFQGNQFVSVLRHDFVSSKWYSIRHAKVIPPRYDHSVSALKNIIYVFGGVVGRRNITSELWTYDTLTGLWTKWNDDTNDVNKLPYRVSGHSAHIVDPNTMLVFFGFNPYRSYLSTVQEYNIRNNTWRLIQTTGAVPRGTYKHASVFDKSSGLVFLYGGHYSHASHTLPGQAASVPTLSDNLYSYNHPRREWKILQSSGFHHYIHSAVLLDGLVLVYGGNAHNETIVASSKPTHCYSQYFLAYDTVCGVWHSMSYPDYLTYSISRYGHSAVTYNGSMYIFGGFNGQMLSDLLRYTPGDCTVHTTAEACLSSHEGARCLWMKDESRCIHAGVTYKLFETESGNGCLQTGSDISVKVRCEEFDDCYSCLNNPSPCNWCDESNTAAKCAEEGCASDYSVARAESAKDKSGYTIPDLKSRSYCSARSRLLCHRLQTCIACNSISECHWGELDGRQGGHSPFCQYSQETLDADNAVASKYKDLAQPSGAKATWTPLKLSLNLSRTCPNACAQQTDCRSCLNGSGANCMWCGNLRRCIDINAYVTSFPYGQCLHWATRASGCDGSDECSYHLTCTSCQANGPGCGWCDDGSRTGLGRCMPGSMSAPVVPGPPPDGEMMPDLLACPADRWYFSNCPACQCNGHGVCSNQTDLLEPGQSLPCQNCLDLTVGEHCETCKNGYFGNALNGGNCSRCDCNGNANDCHPLSGKCYCFAKGVAGDKCERCDFGGKYVGDPRNSSCFYELTVDFVFTFSLTNEEDANISRIAFQNRPIKEGADVTFKLECNSAAKVNLTIKSGDGSSERTMLRNAVCSKIERRFDAEEFKIGGDHNTTFFVYVYDFQTPVILQISFAQSPAIDWIKFFITFASCFLSLLIVAAIMWKIKLRWDAYRRRQRMFVEMAQMASRPSGNVQLELPNMQHVLAGHKA